MDTPQWDSSSVGVIIPTRNASSHWPALIAGLQSQGLPARQVLIIDSDSIDGTRELAQAANFVVHKIHPREFSHGGTRQLGTSILNWAKIAVYLTQDAVLNSPTSIRDLVAPFADPKIAATYGRQLPRAQAGPIEAHARLFNYPETGEVRDLESRRRLGIKAAFLSNSFSAFRVDALRSVGGFPPDVIMAEDTLATARLLLDGWKVAYVPQATVIHSHPLNLVEEFRRYFDTGVYHSRENWLIEQFGQPTGEGKRYVRSELRYLSRHGVTHIPLAVMRSAAKLIAYQLGRRETLLGPRWSRLLSLHKGFWEPKVQGAK